MPKFAGRTEPATTNCDLQKRQDASIDSKSNVQTNVDFSKLETAALKRYRRRFKLVEVGPNSSKEQLVNAVRKHFTSLELDELQVIAGFIEAAKRLKT